MKSNNQKLPIFKNENIEDYISNKEYISSHGLMDILRSPFHYKKGLEKAKEPTKAMIIGSAFHSLLLEPKEFDKEYMIFNKPERDKTMASKENKLALLEMKEKCGNKLLMEDEFDIIQNMKNEAISNKRIMELMDIKGYVEQSIYFEDQEFKVKAKIRPDKNCIDNDTLIDVKTTNNASPDDFARQCMNFNYDLQLAFYADTLSELSKSKYTNIFIIAIENQYPYACQVYNCVELGFIDIGRKKYKKAMAEYVECLKTKKWKGYEKYSENEYGIIDLKLPPWYLRSQYENSETI